MATHHCGCKWGRCDCHERYTEQDIEDAVIAERERIQAKLKEAHEWYRGEEAYVARTAVDLIFFDLLNHLVKEETK